MTVFQSLQDLFEDSLGVPLLEPRGREEFLKHLNAGVAIADPAAAVHGPLQLIESPNCADAIELRGRWDAEVIAPAVAANGAMPAALGAALAAAVAQYESATAELLAKMAACKPEVRASSMSAHPRITRYTAMKQVYRVLHGKGEGEGEGKYVRVDPTLAFSCVNLSYDYDDGAGECDLAELNRTAGIILHTCLSFFAAAS